MGWRCSQKRPPSLPTSLTLGCSCGRTMGCYLIISKMQQLLLLLRQRSSSPFPNLNQSSTPSSRDTLPEKPPFLAPGNSKGHLCPPHIPWCLAQEPASSAQPPGPQSSPLYLFWPPYILNLIKFRLKPASCQKLSLGS